LITGVLNIPLFLIGLVYLNSLEVDWVATGIGFFILCLYTPLWFYSQNEAKKAAMLAKERNAKEKEKISAETPV
jgi:hypothetical protein